MFRQKLYQFADRGRSVFQERRADLFFDLLQPVAGARVLDLGGNRGQFAQRLASRIPLQITVADILDFSSECSSLRFDFVQLEEGAPLPFAAQEFDYVVSNSVIEHVTLSKADCMRRDIPEAEWVTRSHGAQAAFAAEIRRVGRGYFVQTPHPGFPIDLHLWLPFTNRLSHRQLIGFVAISDRIWIKQTGCPDWQLLAESTMETLFPDGEIHVERALGFPKSIVAYRPCARRDANRRAPLTGSVPAAAQ